mmetsp:Transcript_33935/g.73468  ORF Transcript_33935/g.73468 Transcript_33935/m.73468 type:complete len:137 (-) Transcript_33935:65-475(-)
MGAIGSSLGEMDERVTRWVDDVTEGVDATVVEEVGEEASSFWESELIWEIRAGDGLVADAVDCGFVVFVLALFKLVLSCINVLVVGPRSEELVLVGIKEVRSACMRLATASNPTTALVAVAGSFLAALAIVICGGG